MNARVPLALAVSAALAGCIFGNAGSGVDPTVDPYARKPLLTTDWTRATLTRGGTVAGQLTHCPEIIVDRSTSTPLYVGGRYRLGMRGLPAGVTVSWPDGDTLVVPQRGQPGYDALPPANDLGTRLCQTRPFVLARSASSDLVSENVVPTVQHELDAQAVTAQHLVVVGDAAAAPPPPAAAACSSGRWTDMATPAPALVNTAEFDAALDSLDRTHISLVRATDSGVLLDQRDAGSWRREVIATPVPPQLLRTVRAGAQSRLVDLSLVAWRETDFSRPRDVQSRVMLAWRPVGSDWVTEALGADFENNVRGLALAISQAEAVVGWVGDGGARLRTAEVGSRVLSDLALPADLPATGVVRRLLLATDRADEALLLALAVREADGATRLRSWLRARPGSDWVPLPVLDAGPAGPFQDLGDLAVSLDRGEVLMAWSWGTTRFASSTARQQLQLQRWTAGTGWRALADTTLLPDAARRYALQPQDLQVSPCGEAAFLAWGEPMDYPRGAVHGARASGGRWDTFGHANLAPLPDGTGAFSSRSRLLAGHDGRPVLAVLLAQPSGGPAPLVLRHYAP